MGTNNKKNEIVISKGTDITLASSQLIKRGLEFISELDPRRKHVPKDYPTIAEALDHAVDGDTIEIAEGIYKETLRITKPVELVGCEIGKVIFESTIEYPVITYLVNSGNSKIRNIVIKKTDELIWGIGIEIIEGVLEVENCRFEDFRINAEDFTQIKEQHTYDALLDTPSSAVHICSDASKSKFIHCSFVDCTDGIKLEHKSCVDLNSCSFINSFISSSSYGDIRSSSCFYVSCGFWLNSYDEFESSYDTYLGENLLIYIGTSCKASYIHATIVAEYLLDEYEVDLYSNFFDEESVSLEGDLPPKDNPSIHFSDSVVITLGFFSYFIEGNLNLNLSQINSAIKGILTFSKNNLISIPPYFLCQDPLVFFENTIARLDSNSPARNSASDGTNIGAWQGNKKKERVISKNNDINLASSQFAKRGLEIISELGPRWIYVPNDYPSITEAIDHARDNDTIELAEGIYRESVQITKPVTICGASNSLVILESPIDSPTFIYHVTHGISKIKNIAFRKVSEQDLALGIYGDGDFFEFEDCQFENFSYKDDYLPCYDEFLEYLGKMTAVLIVKTDSKAKFLHCSFINNDLGIRIKDKSCINLSNCNFISTSVHKPASIHAGENCNIKSSMSFFSKGSIYLGLNDHYESSYDTFKDVSGIITPIGSCLATFSHSTFVSGCLLPMESFPERLADPEIKMTEKKINWTSGKPKIHFSNCIVFVNNFYKPQEGIGFTTGTEPMSLYRIYTFDVSSNINLINEGIMSYSDKNLLKIPPFFQCQNPMVIFENNTARLSSNSPALKSASDGTNLGAWQGD